MYFDNKFISTLPEFLKNVNITSAANNKKLLEKIALVANSPSFGTEDECEKNCAQQIDKKMRFFVKKEKTHFPNASALSQLFEKH